MERVPSIDQSGLHTLEDIVLQWTKAGKKGLFHRKGAREVFQACSDARMFGDGGCQYWKQTHRHDEHSPMGTESTFGASETKLFLGRLLPVKAHFRVTWKAGVYRRELVDSNFGHRSDSEKTSFLDWAYVSVG
jgi:hypothetical protein